MSINWYPGHMKKTRDLIQANLKLVDAVVELLDARIPLSSRNPQFDDLIGSKKRIIVLNKADLADSGKTMQWIEYYQTQKIEALPINASTGQGIDKLIALIKATCQDEIIRATEKGRLHRPIRIMIIGIPNVGKSSLINKLAGKNAAKTGNKPGVTKGKQWIRINRDIELFDTPGILWPKIEEDLMGIKLASTGAIKDEVLNIEDIAFHLINVILERYADAFFARYDLEPGEDTVAYMEAIGRKRGCLMRGNQVDLEKASRLIVDEFRKGIIGKITLETTDIILKEAE
ncbi:MAG: ribosome biosis GTPase [Clostridiales bacterium]|nr:ribosome biosis GTPase [Clostridiales bacterium]MDN5299632.1 ribosome biosis GTPase [Clostridiales bacterium]